MEEEQYTSENASPERWAVSPLKRMVDDGEPEIRRRILGSGAGEEFSILEDLRQQCAKDYFGMVYGFGVDEESSRRFGVVFTWTTDRESGFNDGDLDFFRKILPALALTLRVAANRRFAQA